MSLPLLVNKHNEKTPKGDIIEAAKISAYTWTQKKHGN